MAIDASRRPDDLDEVDPVGRSQAEVKPWVGSRLVAAATDAIGHTAPAPSSDGNPGPDGVAVGGAALQPEGQPVAAVGPVV